MVNIIPVGPLIAPGASTKIDKERSGSIVDTVKKTQQPSSQPPLRERRKNKEDRRQTREGQKPLIEMRSGRDRRRYSPGTSEPSIDINA